MDLHYCQFTTQSKKKNIYTNNYDIINLDRRNKMDSSNSNGEFDQQVNNTQNVNQIPPMDNNINNENIITNPPIDNTQQTPATNTGNNNTLAQKSRKAIVKILAIIGGIVVAIIVFIIIIFLVTSASSNKLVCESNEGNITLMYNDSNIKGYTARGITYDMKQQQEIAKQIGIDSYLEEFKTWFETNTTGTCSKKEK